MELPTVNRREAHDWDRLGSGAEPERWVRDERSAQWRRVESALSERLDRIEEGEPLPLDRLQAVTIVEWLLDEDGAKYRRAVLKRALHVLGLVLGTREEETTG